MYMVRLFHWTQILPSLMLNLIMENGGHMKTVPNLKLRTSSLPGVRCPLARSMTFLRFGQLHSPLTMMSPHSRITVIYTLWLTPPHFPAVMLIGIHTLLQNPNFHNKFDYTPHQEDNTDGNHCFHNVMSGNWCWHEAVSILPFIYYWLTTFNRMLLQKTPRHMVQCLYQL